MANIKRVSKLVLTGALIIMGAGVSSETFASDHVCIQNTTGESLTFSMNCSTSGSGTGFTGACLSSDGATFPKTNVSLNGTVASEQGWETVCGFCRAGASGGCIITITLNGIDNKKGHTPMGTLSIPWVDPNYGSAHFDTDSQSIPTGYWIRGIHDGLDADTWVLKVCNKSDC